MAEETKDEAKKGGIFPQIVTAVAVALLAGGTSPWWFNALTGKGKPEVQPAPITEQGQEQQKTQPAQSLPTTQLQPATVKQPEPAAKAEDVASHEFFVGRWEAEQTINGITNSVKIDYLDNSRYEGVQTQMVGYMGQRANVSGTWMLEKLSDKMFRVYFNPDGGMATNARFKIIDHNHIQNLDLNFVAERIE